jgi:ribose 5-phosphate isomerase B
MKPIAIASDHAGFKLKQYLLAQFAREKVDFIDCGCISEDRVDYIGYTLKVVSLIADSTCERGILLCGNGFAMAMLANRVPGMRAAVCHDAYTARTAREMGNANIISLGARVVGLELAWELTRIWLNSEFHIEPVKATNDGVNSGRSRVGGPELVALT